MIGIHYNYYNNPEILGQVVEYYEKLNNPNVKFNIVDDGSQDVPLTLDMIPDTWDAWVITEDVGWNCNGARNLLMHETEYEWNLHLDLDLTLFEKSFKKLHKIVGTLNKDKCYRVFRTERPDRPQHPNSMMIHRDLFWSIGGYPEHRQGYYNTGSPFHKQLTQDSCSKLWCYTIAEHASLDREHKNGLIDAWKKIEIPPTDDGTRLRYPWRKL